MMKTSPVFQLCRLSVLATVLVAVSACGVFKSTTKENITPPKELTEITPTAQVERLFRKDLGEGEENQWNRMTPSSDGASIFMTDAQGQVSALSLDTGNKLWSVDTNTSVASGPGVGEGTVVLGTMDGEVIALDPNDGSERWRARVSSEVIASPVVHQGVAVVRANDGRIFGFNSNDGERLWSHESTVPKLTLRGNGKLLAMEGVVFAGLDNGKVIALDVQSGNQIWEVTVANPNGRFELDRMVDLDGAMAVSDGVLYAAGFNGRAAAMTLNTGSPIWDRELSTYGGVALDGDRLYLTTKDGTVWALDRDTGSALWQQDGLAWRWLSTPAVHNGTVVVADLEGYVHWLDRESGAFVARSKLGGEPVRAQPLVVGDVAVIIDTEGQLAAYRISR